MKQRQTINFKIGATLPTPSGVVAEYKDGTTQPITWITVDSFGEIHFLSLMADGTVKDVHDDKNLRAIKYES